MSSIPDVPSILYCTIPATKNKDEICKSNSVKAVLTHLSNFSGTIRAVRYEEHVRNPSAYVIQLQCKWTDDRPKATIGLKQGFERLRAEKYDVLIQTKQAGGYWFVLLNPLDVVYRVFYHGPGLEPVLIASTLNASIGSRHNRTISDPRRPQQDVDDLLFKLNRPTDSRDHFSVDKIAASYQKNSTWAKDDIVAILKRCTIEQKFDQSGCWHCVLLQGESRAELRLRVLFLSFGRESPSVGSGFAVEHFSTDSNQDKNIVCLRPSHLHLVNAVDVTTLQTTVKNLHKILEQLHVSSEYPPPKKK